MYFTTSDRGGGAAGEAWRVRPVTVSLSGGDLVITGALWLIVRPALYQGFGNPTLDPAQASTFASALEVYRRSTDGDGTAADTAPVLLIWESGLCATDPAAVSTAVGRAGIRDPLLGVVTPVRSVYDATAGVWGACDGCYPTPDRITVRALAGYPLSGGRMDRQWTEIVARLAAAEMARKICACDQANTELYYWQFDLSRTSGANDESYATTQNILECPWGTRRGHVWAWRQVQRQRHLVGLLP